MRTTADLIGFQGVGVLPFPLQGQETKLLSSCCIYIYIYVYTSLSLSLYVCIYIYIYIYTGEYWALRYFRHRRRLPEDTPQSLHQAIFAWMIIIITALTIQTIILMFIVVIIFELVVVVVVVVVVVLLLLLLLIMIMIILILTITNNTTLAAPGHLRVDDGLQHGRHRLHAARAEGQQYQQ